jgi:opacity protein-like surface antigen
VHTRFVRPFLAAAVLLAAVVTPAAAQTGTSSHPFVIHGQAGVTFGGPTGGLFGAGAGVGIPAVRGLTIFGEFGRLTNIMNSELEDLVNDLVELEDLEEFTDDFEFEVRLPTTYGFAGARFDVTRNRPLTVFVEGGVGFARVGVDVTLIVDGEDFSDDFADFLEEQDAAVTSTEALFVIGAGVSWPVTPRASVTGGLRINRIAAGDGITKPAVYVGVIWRP